MHDSEEMTDDDEFFGMCIRNTNNISSLKVRYITFNDQNSNSRKNWVNKVFSQYTEFDYSDHATNFISIAHDDFDALVVGGDDTRRVSKILRLNQAILNRRLKISVMARSNAKRRAQILSAGFDDVMDIIRVQPPEAIARVSSMWMRYQARFSYENVEKCLNSRIEKFAHLAALNPREQRIMAAFIENERNYISYFSLRQLSSDGHDLITDKNLKVIISKLRRKLRKNVNIRSIPLLGYVLVY